MFKREAILNRDVNSFMGMIQSEQIERAFRFIGVGVFIEDDKEVSMNVLNERTFDIKEEFILEVSQVFIELFLLLEI